MVLYGVVELLNAILDIRWGQQAWIERLYNVHFVGECSDGQVGFPLLLNISCNFTNSQVGQEVWKCSYPCCMWFGATIIRDGPHLGKTSAMENVHVSRYLGLPSLVVWCQRPEARGQRVLCSWPVGSAPSGIQTTHRSSVAPKTGVFTLVGGVELGHCDLMGYIPTLY